jgi:hypothetical protein
MDDAERGPAFLVRFEGRADRTCAGVATHIQSGERVAFTGLREVVRIFRSRCEGATPPDRRNTEE